MNHKNHALVLIDVQKGFLNSEYWGKRNNLSFEVTAKKLLETFRQLKIPIIHVQHLSEEKLSPLKPGQDGVDFIPGFEPQKGEKTFQKSVNSAFIGTDLEAYLKSRNLSALTMIGFTTDHCVSTSARMAANLGFSVTIIEDCTVTFDRHHLDTIYPADLVHKVSLASLNGEFARILSAADFSYQLQDSFRQTDQSPNEETSQS